MMLSFITVSQPERAKNAERLGRSIAEAGYDVEPALHWALTIMDPAGGGICRAYNRGAEHRGDILCFVHDDVEFLATRRLLDPVLEMVQREETGFVGVAGTKKLLATGSWAEDPGSCLGMVGYTRKPTSEEPCGFQFAFWPTHVAPFPIVRFGQALVLDGLILFVTPRVFKLLRGFDEVSFPGWHFYDVDITLRAHLAGLKNYVMPFPVCHGQSPRREFPGEQWNEDRMRFLAKHVDRLPMKI